MPISKRRSSHIPCGKKRKLLSIYVESSETTSQDVVNNSIFDGHHISEMTKLAARKAHTLYKGVWDTPDHLTFITDTKDTTQTEVMLAFSQLVYLAQKTHPEVLARIIPQIYNEDMLPWIEAVYPFPSIIYTLYQVSWTPESVLDFCMNSGVRFVTMPQDQVTEEALRLWDTLGIRVGVHTVNDPLQAQQLFDLGVDMLYTDFLTPAGAPL